MARPGYEGLIQRRQAVRPTRERGMFHRALHSMQGRKVGQTPVDDIPAVLARLADTPDGKLFLQWIHDQTLGHQVSQDAPEGALRASVALNSFATKIFNLLDRGLKRDGNG